MKKAKTQTFQEKNPQNRLFLNSREVKNMSTETKFTVLESVIK